MKYEPKEHNRSAIQFIISHSYAAIFQDPGMGKTAEVYASFKILRKRGLVQNMLVIAPLRPAQSTWPAEARKWDDFHDLKVVVLHGKNKEELLCLDADVFVINPEGLSWLFQSMQGATGWWDMLVVDESTKFKHSSSQRFKLLKGYLQKFKRRYILTGSPAPNGYMDLFGQIYILDLGHALGRFITHYRNNFFELPYQGSFDWRLRRGSDKAIEERIKPLTLRMEATDWLDLPPLLFNEVEVDLPDEAMAIYRQMENVLIAQLGEEVIMAPNAGAAANKCRQIANGGIFHEGAEEWTHIHEAKLDAVEEIIEELSGKPCLVAYEYRHDLERLRKRFGEIPFIGGGVSSKVFHQIEQDWNKGLIPILLAQPQSVSHGLNLQGTGAAIIKHSLGWDLEVDEQFVRRVWRQGQKERVVVHSIVARGTIDEMIVKLMHKKDRTQRGLLQALKLHLQGPNMVG